MGFKETVMGLAGRVSDTVDRGIEAGKDNYQKMSEKSRLNKELKQLNSEIDNIFLTVGKQLFETSPEAPEYKELFDSLRDMQVKVQNVKKQLNLLDGMLLCDKCGSTVPENSKVCNQCGAEIKRPEPVVIDSTDVEVISPDTGKKCPSCGSEMPDGAKFCGKCGAQL